MRRGECKCFFYLLIFN